VRCKATKARTKDKHPSRPTTATRLQNSKNNNNNNNNNKSFFSQFSNVVTTINQFLIFLVAKFGNLVIFFQKMKNKKSTKKNPPIFFELG
jgi:hypothetical protein